MMSIHLDEGPVRRPQQHSDPLIRKIQRACRISLPEPDLALNLDVADYINEKQGATPREAAISIVRLINSRDSHTAIFALSLLDVLVKNCGYPFHLQISRKEFLNELVKRFPERPPVRFSKVQRLILTAIEEWYQTICKHSPYKDDMGYIRDMHRLLKYKGYTFPKINSEDLAVLKPSDHLKTPSEIQKEQEIAQAAKLEELIRRGRPEDLREANKLMKVMAGFKEDNAIQSRQILNEELTKLKRKADLLNEMLGASEAPDMENETIAELYNALKSSQPRFQKIIEEEQDDDQFIQDLLHFNDTVNQLVEKYELLKAGRVGEVNQINIPNISATVNNSGALANEINLIDFDDEEEDTGAASSNNNGTASNNTEDDLLSDLNNLSFSDNKSNNNFGFGGSIALGSTTPAAPVTTTTTTTTSNNNFDLLGDLSSPSPVQTQQTNSFSNDLLSDLSSAPPSQPQNQTASSNNRQLVSQSDILKFEFLITRESESTIKVTSFFSNLSISQISDLTLMLAVPKAQSLRLLPQSNTTLSSFSTDGIYQESWIDNAVKDAPKPLRVKWKVSYKVNGTPKEESSVFTFPNI
ncbi:hypothetical protein C6P41_003488 [Kluyveromyces marxianus]|nr:hypothetical protein C6P43_005031 [Kluyveromyces marxianus]KAG0682805.1 hypothetical protein C6P41_003488 [Kluyveromyces marxianus]